MPRRGKRLALWTAGLAGVVLAVGLVLSHRRLVEEWHLYKARSGTPEERLAALDKLAEMGSARAVPYLLAMVVVPVGGKPEAKPVDGETIHGYSLAGAASSWTESHHDVGDLIRTPGYSPAEATAARFLLWELVVECVGDKPPILTSGGPEGFQMVARGDAERHRRIAAVLDAVRAARPLLDRIGAAAIPVLERAAAADSLAPAVRRFAVLELARMTGRAQPAEPRLVVPGGRASLQLIQRTGVELPGSSGRVSIAIGDITRGQVMVTVTPDFGPDALAASMREGDRATIELDGKTFTLTLEKLENFLIGNDRATFILEEED